MTLFYDPGRELPLFLLNCVLFPKGVLKLRVFEKRYVDMVRQQMRTNQPFGICLIRSGREVGEVCDFEPIGCLAHIIDFDVSSTGLLEIRCMGHERFEVTAHRVEPDGLTVANVRLLKADHDSAVPPSLAACGTLAKELVKKLESKLAGNSQQVIAEPYEFESASWVANRLSEVLPISNQMRQDLMAEPDPVVRLGKVDAYLREQEIFSDYP